MTTIYKDTDNPEFVPGLKCYSLADCAKHVSNNYSYLKDQLEDQLGLTPKWKAEAKASGSLAVQTTYSAATEPEPWKLTRIQQMPSGFQTLSIKRGTVTLQVQSNSFSDAYCVDVQKFIDERMQSTRDKMLKAAATEKQAAESKAQTKAKDDLAKAKKVLARDLDMPDFQRTALHRDSLYMASLRDASAIVNAAGKAKAEAKAEARAEAKAKVARAQAEARVAAAVSKARAEGKARMAAVKADIAKAKARRCT